MPYEGISFQEHTSKKHINFSVSNVLLGKAWKSEQHSKRLWELLTQ